MGLRIESLGLSGSGKTTLAKACRKRLAAGKYRSLDANGLDELDAKTGSGYPVIWKSERLRQAHNIAKYFQSCPDIAAYFQKLYQDNPRNLGIMAAIGGDWAKAKRLDEKFDAFWVDEGFLHYGIHAAFKGKDTNGDLKRLISIAPKPGAILVTKCDTRTAIEGLQNRMGASGLSKSEITAKIESIFGGENELNKRAEMIEIVVSEFASKGVDIAEVDAHGDLEEMSETVLSQFGFATQP